MCDSKAKEKGSKRNKQEREKKSLRFWEHMSLLSWAPGKCPVGHCEQWHFPTSLMVHLLNHHSHDVHTMVSTIYDNHFIRLTFDPLNYQKGVPKALAILLYGGIENNTRSLPGRRLLSYANEGLLNHKHCFEHHLVLTLMICKTTWHSLLKDNETADELEDINETDATIYVIWMVAPVFGRHIYYTLTIFDSLYMQSRSVVRKTRNFARSQNPSDLASSSNYMLIRNKEAMELTKAGGKPGIQLELIVNEKPGDKFMKTSSPPHLLETFNSAETSMPRIKVGLNRKANKKLPLNRKPLSNPKLAVPLQHI
ncbi:uncharacterized protein LOC108137123 [Drosophila elegans]|uniref:uncharacterized protein LOC108137123 n=1 Tax=Drosophila elegans TaxID=30023 RepID=UPI001BC85986|nr:uncharacterized protein LOC108137123 [Drosophila elegans]